MKKICIVLINLLTLVILAGCSASIDCQPAQAEEISVGEATETAIPIPIVDRYAIEEEAIPIPIADRYTIEEEASIPIPVVIGPTFKDLFESKSVYTP